MNKHLLIKEKDQSISNIIKSFSNGYVNWYNKSMKDVSLFFQ